jgi:hypothetical protein
MDNTIAKLLRLLQEARAFENETCRDARDMARWHREVDKVLVGTVGDDPRERYDDPRRVEHRKFVQRMGT